MFRCNEKLIVTLERRSETIQVGTISDQTNLRNMKKREWKATELRTLLLSVGPIVLKGIMRPEKYIHFLSLSVSIGILLDEDCSI